MSEKPEQTGRRLWTVPIFSLVVLAGGYVGGYFLLGRHVELLWGDNVRDYVIHERFFPNLAVRKAYYPLGWLEWKLRGDAVVSLLTEGSMEDADMFGVDD